MANKKRTFELSINVDYLRNWGEWEGVRELAQNAVDAQTEHNAPMEIDWHNGTLRIQNKGCVLKREALLLGTTTKADRDDMIGSFGEGLKLGILALVRAGRSVKIRTGSEVWMPTIARSERFAADVLTFYVTDGHKDENRVRVEIGGVSEPEWLEYRARFLFLRDGRESSDHTVKTPEGDLLLHERYHGKVYVKGIWVYDDPVKLRYGYNLRIAELDRDRKVVTNEWERDRTFVSILNTAVKSRPDLWDTYFDLVEDIDNGDTEAISEYRLPDQTIIDAAVARFVKRHGRDAVPVRTLADSADVEHFGMKGVIVGGGMAAILESKYGKVSDLKAKFATAITKKYAISELTKDERRVLRRSVRIVRKANKLKGVLARVDVVDFHDDKLRGLHTNGRIAIARRVLTQDADYVDWQGTVRTLIHELAHDAGADGDKGHVSTIERYWQAVLSYVMENKR